MKILMAAGGSGGHIFPAIALAKELKKSIPDIGIMFIGSDKELDRRIFEKERLDFKLISSNKFPYKASPAIIAFTLKFLVDLFKVFFILLKYKPDAVVGFGGYVPCPVLISASILRIPKVVHEQNVSPGRANKLMFTLADKVAISFEETKRFLGKDMHKAVFTGNPIRIKDFMNGDIRAGKDVCVRKFGLDVSKFTILVVGGSEGAHALNETFTEALSNLDDRLVSSLQVIHITGVKDYEWAIKVYEDLNAAVRIFSFIDRIEEAYGAADLVITRAGASAIFEVAFFGKPMILVPYKFAMSHQMENAHVFFSRGAAIELDESKLSSEVFKEALTGLLNDRSRLEKMAECVKRLSVPAAAENLARETLKAMKG